jgi:hypothetical protein
MPRKDDETMSETLKWKQAVANRVAKMSNRELFDAFSEQSTEFDTHREQWEREYIRKTLMVRLARWLNDDRKEG